MKHLVFFMCIPLLLSWQFGRKETRPNIVVIFTDDQTYRAIGYNNPEIHTPELDRLAEEGIIFKNHYTATPICAASRASMMTGLFPQQHGTIALDWKSFIEEVCNDPEYPTIARLLSQAGYQTWFSGKSHLGPPQAYGFKKGKIFHDPKDRAAFSNALKMIGEYQTDNKPFFLWLAPRQPHVPLIPDNRWLNLYDTSCIALPGNFRESPLMQSMFNQGLPGELFFRDCDYTHNWKNLPAGPPRSVAVIKDFTKAYYATISHLDHQVGRLVDVLEQKGLKENTVIIFLSDNGYFLGNHGLGNKITMHEESVRVPLFIHWDGLKKKGFECRQLVSSLDVFPTVLELAGIPVPSHVFGTSLIPLFSDPETPIHDYVVSECVGKGGKTGQGHRMVRTLEWKYILTGTSEEVLYDELGDPHELVNLIKEHPEIAGQMREYLANWMNQTGDQHTLRGVSDSSNLDVNSCLKAMER